MMKDIEIKISRETRMVDLSKTTIGNDGENLQGNLVFSFTDDFVKGQGRLEYVINGESKYAFLLSNDENYYIPIKSVMTKEGQIDMQLVITEGTDVNEIPIFKSNVFYVSCKKSINAEVEEEEGYYSWIEIANTKLNEIDEVVKNVETKLANGEFNGKDGVDGKDGKDFTYEDFTEEQLENLRGPQGVPGEPGADGKDYVLTEADKEEIADNINEENDTRITENEKDIAELEATIDILTNTDTKKGELVHITDALPLPTPKIRIDGNVEQETTEGYQLFNAYAIKNTDIVVEDNGKTIKPPLATSGNGFVGTNTKLSELCPNLKVGDVAYLYFDMINISANSLIYINTVNITWQKNTSQTITQEMLDSTVVLYGNRFTSGETEQGILQNFRIVKVQNAPWEKFTNGASPNPEYPQEIEVIEGDLSFKVTGKNLIKNMRETATINGLTFTHNEDDSITVNGTATANTPYYFHSPVYGEVLTFSKETLVTCSGITTGGSSTYRLVYNYLLDNVEKSGPIIMSKETQSRLPAGAKIKAYIYVASGTTLNNVTFYPMIRLASDNDSTYEPYKEQVTTIDLKGNWAGKVIGNTTSFADYLVTDKKRLWLVKNIGKITLGNVVKLYTATSGEFGTFNYGSFSVPNVLIKGRHYNFACDRVHKANEQYSPYGGYLNNNGFVVLADEDDTLESFNAKINGATLYYPLAEPQTIYLGELPEPIKTFEGINNIQLLANLDTEIEVKYALDVKKYFENKLASIQEQIL